jgi:hypothetical protein
MKTINENNGNVLIKGIELTNEQRSLLKFNLMADDLKVKCHSFWFKNGLPSTEEGFYYPVCHSFKFLPY